MADQSWAKYTKIGAFYREILNKIGSVMVNMFWISDFKEKIRSDNGDFWTGVVYQIHEEKGQNWSVFTQNPWLRAQNRMHAIY